MNHDEFVATLRKAADFFESHPELGTPSFDHEYTFTGDIGAYSSDSKEGLAFFARTLGGKIDKIVYSDIFTLKSKQDGFTLKAIAWRNNVCSQVQVGTKIAPAELIPAVPEQILPEREVPIMEWKCPSLLSEDEEKSL